MKRILSYSLLLSLLLLSNCKKLVDEQPLSDGTLDQFFKTKYDVYAAVAGMYGAFQQTMIGESQFNNRITWWGDSRSDNCLLYTSDAADERSSVDLGGRR